MQFDDWAFVALATALGYLLGVAQRESRDLEKRIGDLKIQTESKQQTN